MLKKRFLNLDWKTLGGDGYDDILLTKRHGACSFFLKGRVEELPIIYKKRVTLLCTTSATASPKKKLGKRYDFARAYQLSVTGGKKKFIFLVKPRCRH